MHMWRRSRQPPENTYGRTPQAHDYNERRIDSRGYYDLSFFDSDNEYERFSLHPEHARLRSSGRSTEDDLAATMALLLRQRGITHPGLTAAEVERILVPMAGVVGCCTICMADTGSDEGIVRLVCAHVFHADCLRPWLDLSSTCPVCRADLHHLSRGEEPCQERLQ